MVVGICFLFEKNKISNHTSTDADGRDFMPLVFLPEVTFQSNNILLPTLEGQYIIKNLIIISAALVLGGEINRSKNKRETTADS
jgi:hypothetical protein